MPCYRWKGINLFGRLQTGQMRAISHQILEQELFARDIGLLAAREKKSFFSFVKDAEILFFFQRLGSLLCAGVHLHDALMLLSSKARSSAFADTLEEVALSVERGRLLHEALGEYPKIFEPLLVEVCRVGSEGDLSAALSLLCGYLEQRARFKKKLKRAAFMPAMTGIFFVAIFIGILLLIIPRFAHMFASLHVEVPAFTQWLLNLSTYLQSLSFFYSGVVVASAVAILQWLLSTKYGVWIWHCLQLRIPYSRQFIVERDKALFFNALGLLLKAGVPLVGALDCALNVVQNSWLKSELRAVHAYVQDGHQVSYAVEQVSFIDEELSALLAVGERSGRLANLIIEVAMLSRERLMQRISFLTKIIQPLLLIILACSVAGLMLAVYVPLLTLSYAIA